MPALVFPNPEVLRLVLANEVAPREATQSPARAGHDSHGRPWIEPSVALNRETLVALTRLGVQPLGVGGLAAESIRSWAELVPLKPAPISIGPVLFELPD